jgi:agmatine deiminase
MIRRMPAEWETQDGILIAWPHAATDWRPLLDEVVPVFAKISSEVSRKEKVVIVTPELAIVEDMLITAGVNMANVRLYEFETNDTWTRDYGPITVIDQTEPTLLNFGFNGWGLKFPAYLDNCITSHLYAAGAFSDLPLDTVGLIMEGGSIESDGKGTILTTSECLMNQNRNPHLSREEIEEKLKQLLGAERILWLENGYLAGDDTDSHIDTLVRFAPEDTILYVACDNPDDEHFETLNAMREELKRFRTRDNRPYRLLPLPWPNAKYDEDGERLPATYANFLIINGAVLVPTYRDASDEAAIDKIRQAFPGREIIGIDCLPLIYQHGSLHCVTMQMPKGTLCKA